MEKYHISPNLEKICAVAAPLVLTTLGSSVLMAEGIAEKNPSKIMLASTGYLAGLAGSGVVYSDRSKKIK